MNELEINAAFMDADCPNVATRLAAWTILTRNGLGQIYLVGGKFMQLSLNKAGEEARLSASTNGNYECSCVECGHSFIGHKSSGD